MKENFQIDQLHAGNSDINGYELKDLFDIKIMLLDNLIRINNKYITR